MWRFVGASGVPGVRVCMRAVVFGARSSPKHPANAVPPGAMLPAGAVPTYVPASTPHTDLAGEAARVWWRYAFLGVRTQLRGSRVAWTQLRTACLLRKAYVPAYVRCLEAASAAAAKGSGGKGQGAGQPGAPTAGLGGDAAIAAMDAQLPESTILLFR